MATNSATTKATAGRQGPRVSATLAMLWRTFTRDAFDSYRPELHYMRGPGPRWRARHGIAETGPAVVLTAAASA